MSKRYSLVALEYYYFGSNSILAAMSPRNSVKNERQGNASGPQDSNTPRRDDVLVTLPMQ